MLAEVVELQNRAVTQLERKIKEKDNITFKAPTGSGKTHMMADLMNRVLGEDDSVVFLVSSLSKGDLAEQNFKSFEELKETEFTNLNPYLINSEIAGEEKLFIPEDRNVYVLPRDLYKETSRLNNGAMMEFFFTMGTKSKKIYLIKDECHIATNKLDELGTYFQKVINFSATPKLSRGQIADVEITEKEAEDAHLIKSIEPGGDWDGVDEAFDKLLEVQQKYIDNDFNMRPCLIIQISNKDKAVEEITKLKTLMVQKYPDLHWCTIMDKDKDAETNDKILHKLPPKKWKDELKKKESTVDVIIFKMVITEGWDIPRACMLYQIRDSKSKQLDEQVIGRVRRNPMLLTFDKISETAQKVASVAYVWGISDEEKRKPYEVKVVGNEVLEELRVITTRLKKIPEVNTFNVGDFLGKRPKCADKSIFELWKNKRKITEEVDKLYNGFVKDVDSWFLFMNNVDALETEVKNIETDYEHNLEIVKDKDGFDKSVSVPEKTYFVSTTIKEGNINKWIWKRTDEGGTYCFDSEAEKEWCGILYNLRDEEMEDGDDESVLKKLKVGNKKIYLVGKNFYNNSEICYQYYLCGIHSSFPDFIMKDSQGRIHLFEVKSLDGQGASFDKTKYEDKILAILEGYKAASKLTDYYFYVPLKNGEKWDVWQYHNGQEKQFKTSKEFVEWMRKKA